MKRKFITNLGFLLFLNLLVKPFWIFGIDRTVQNIANPGEYGFYFTVLNFTFLFNILLDFGITNFNNKNIAQNNQLLNKHFSGITLLRFVLAAIYFVIIFIIASLIGYDGRHLYFLAFLGFNQFLVSFILYLRSNISGLLLFRIDSAISVLDRLLMILFCSILLWGNITTEPFRIIWFVYAQTLAYIITAFIAMLIVIKKAAFKRLQWNTSFFLMIIKQSFPFALLVLLMSFYNRIDSVMLERLLPKGVGTTQVDIYAKAYRLLDAVNMIAYLFSVLLIPIFARLIKDKLPVEGMVKLSFTIIFTISMVIATGSSFFSDQIMTLLYVGQIQEAQKVFVFLIIGFIPISATYIFGTLLTANGSLKALNIMALTGMVLNISLNYFLIPSLLAVGSAYASLATQFITAIIQVAIAQQIFKFTINWKYIFTLLFFALGVIVLNLISYSIHWDWRIGLIIAGLASVLWAFVLNLLSVGGFIRLLKNE
ncbi:MAG: oligosaccharide flippase family protein [Bacteroidales bacterium]